MTPEVSRRLFIAKLKQSEIELVELGDSAVLLVTKSQLPK